MTLCLDHFILRHLGRTEGRYVRVLQTIIQRMILVAAQIGAQVEIMEVEDF